MARKVLASESWKGRADAGDHTPVNAGQSRSMASLIARRLAKMSLTQTIRDPW
jgi:hypothetical protein